MLTVLYREPAPGLPPKVWLKVRLRKGEQQPWLEDREELEPGFGDGWGREDPVVERTVKGKVGNQQLG